jgi:hypothetical protein
LAVVVLIGAILAHTLKDTAQLLLSSLLPLFGTWVGTVLAFYFSRENFEAANRGTLEMVRSVTQRLGATRVADAMMPRTRMVVLEIPAGQSMNDIRASQVIATFETVGANGVRISRLPVLDATGASLAILHRGVWTEMLATALLRPAMAYDVQTATIGPLLALNYQLTPGQTFATFIQSTIAFVARDRMIADAKAAMERVPHCQDVLVTEHGQVNEPVVGWVSNIDIGRISQP